MTRVQGSEHFRTGTPSGHGQAPEARDPLSAGDTIDLVRRALARAGTAPDAMRIARWVIVFAASEFDLRTDDGDCNGYRLQMCAAEALGRAIDLCRNPDEALSVADLAGAAGEVYKPLREAAFRARHRLGSAAAHPSSRSARSGTIWRRLDSDHRGQGFSDMERGS